MFFPPGSVTACPRWPACRSRCGPRAGSPTLHLSLSVPIAGKRALIDLFWAGAQQLPVRLLVTTVPRWPARPSRLGRVGSGAKPALADHHLRPAQRTAACPAVPPRWACGPRSRLRDGAWDPSPIHRHGSERYPNVSTPGGMDVQLFAIPDAASVTVWAACRHPAGMLRRTVLPCVPGPRYRS